MQKKGLHETLTSTFMHKSVYQSTQFSRIFTHLPSLEASLENISIMMTIWTTKSWREHIFLPIYQFVQS